MKQIERISLGMKQLVSDSFGDFIEINKKGSRVKANNLGSTEDRVDLELSDDVKDIFL